MKKKKKRKSDEVDEKDENTTNRKNDADDEKHTTTTSQNNLIFVPNKEQERERERIKAHLSDSRTFPTIIEKRRGRTVNVSRFSSECEDVLRELKEKTERLVEGVEEKRRLVLSESRLIESEREDQKKGKTLFQFPLTTIEEDFSRQQFSTTTTKRKKGRKSEEEEERAVKAKSNGRGGGASASAQKITTTLSMIKEHTKVMPPRLRREIDLASVVRQPVRAKRRGKDEDAEEEEEEDEDAKKKKKRGKKKRSEREKEKSNVILQVEVYDNCKQFVKYPKLNCEVLVHGDTRLTQLKDEIECLADYRRAAVNYGLVNDLKKKKSDDEDEKKDDGNKSNGKRANKRYIGAKEANEANESGFFFIENVFYDDLRSKNSVSLSKSIVDASKKYFIRCPGMKLEDSDDDDEDEDEEENGKENGASSLQKKEKLKPSNFTSRDMRETTFGDLEIVPGKAYLYRHQGTCDHILRFRDVRMAHMDSETAKLSGEYYPIVISEARTVRKQCMCCETHDATVTAYGDEMAVCSPFFWCDSCFDVAHPTEEEKKSTETYPYFFE